MIHFFSSAIFLTLLIISFSLSVMFAKKSSKALLERVVLSAERRRANIPPELGDQAISLTPVFLQNLFISLSSSL
jgi:hypothetical protein